MRNSLEEDRSMALNLELYSSGAGIDRETLQLYQNEQICYDLIGLMQHWSDVVTLENSIFGELGLKKRG